MPEPGMSRGGSISREQIIARAESWLRPAIPYSQSQFHQNEYGRYRTDCSGYVSMAWGLPGIPEDRHGGLDVVGLIGVSSAICRDELRAGDALLLPDGTNLTRHVTLFDRWADGSSTRYWGYEQAGGVGTVYRIIRYPYDNGSHDYQPRRYQRSDRKSVV